MEGKRSAGVLAVLLASFLVLAAAAVVCADGTDLPFPGYFEILPPCILTSTCGTGGNVTINGTGILNLALSPANGLNDTLVTGVLINVTWLTTTNGTSPYPMNSSVWQIAPGGQQLLLAGNSTADSSHFVQIGPFSYSGSCGALCNMTVFVKSCNATSGVCVNSTADAGGLRTPWIAPSIYIPLTSPTSPRTGDLVTISWFTRIAMNDTLSWPGGSNASASLVLSHSKASASFNATQSVTFVLTSCANGACENTTRAVSVGYSASAPAFSSTAPSTPITVSWTTHAGSNSTLFYSNGSAIQSASDGLFSTSHSVSIGAFSAGNVITYHTGSCLLPNNCEQTGNYSRTISQQTTTVTTTIGGGGSPGGPGGGSFGPPAPQQNGTVVPPNGELSYAQVALNTPVSFNFNGSKQAITTITLNYRTFVPNATIVVERLASEPALSQLPQGTVYQYANITHALLSDGNVIPPVYIEFRVLKSWVSDNNIDPTTIGIFRYSAGAWQALETLGRGEDATYFYFKANSPGLSLFAITGQKRTAFWDIISLIEQYYAGEPGVDFWRVLDALTSYYSSNG